METFRSKSMNVNSGYANYQMSARAIWRLAIYKAGLASRVVRGFLQSEQGQPSTQSITNHALRADNTNKFPAKTYQTRVKEANNNMAHNTTVTHQNIDGIESNNQVDQVENMADMSSAQLVFSVIQKQQVEWMKETRNR